MARAALLCNTNGLDTAPALGASQLLVRDEVCVEAVGRERLALRHVLDGGPVPVCVRVVLRLHVGLGSGVEEPGKPLRMHLVAESRLRAGFPNASFRRR